MPEPLVTVAVKLTDPPDDAVDELCDTETRLECNKFTDSDDVPEIIL